MVSERVQCCSMDVMLPTRALVYQAYAITATPSLSEALNTSRRMAGGAACANAGMVRNARLERVPLICY